MTKFESLEELVAALDNMNVSDLRNLARQFKVVPGIRKRAVLIEKIIGAFKGEVVEEPKKPGRPPKGQQGVRQNEPEIKDDLTAASDNVDPSLPRTGILEIMADRKSVV